MDVEYTSQRQGGWASTMVTLHNHLGLVSCLSKNPRKSTPNLHWHIIKQGGDPDPTHPQHIKVLKLFVYVMLIAETQPWHFIITHAQVNPNNPNNPPPPTCGVVTVWGWTKIPIHSISGQGAQTHCLHITWMWNALHRGFEPQPWHYIITRELRSILKSQKSIPTCSCVTNIKGRPRSPSTALVLKRFVYIVECTPQGA